MVVKLTLQDAKDFAKTKRGKCLSENYKNTQTHLLWECSKKHQWKSHFGNIKNNNR
jgi:hypothetical protein